MMSNIESVQNSQSSLNRLAAQRQLYLEAKKILSIKVVVAVLATTSTFYLSSKFSSNIELHNVLLVVKILVCLVPLVSFDKLIAERKLIAAKIQTIFDVDVFGISWNDTVYGLRGDLSHPIAKFSARYEKRHKDWMIGLQDWYVVPEGESDHLRKVHSCQKENIEWETDLRASFSRSCLTVFILLLMAMLFIAISYNQKTSWTLEYLYLPVLPTLVLLAQVILENHKTLKGGISLQIQSLIVEKLLQDKVYDVSLAVKEVEALELHIFKYRTSAFTIPDFYYRLRSKYLTDLAKRARNY